MKFTNTGRRCFLICLLLSVSMIIGINIYAEELNLGVASPATLAPLANADYTLNLPAPGRLTIVLDGWLSTYNWGTDIDRMYLYNSAGEPVGWGQFGSEEDPYWAHMMETNDSYSINVGAAGIYTLRLHSGAKYQWPAGVTVQSYSITVTLDEVNDINEDNGSIETATAIDIGQTVTAYQWRPISKMSVDNDEDYYRVILPSPGILTISLDNWISTLNWGTNYDRMYIYNSEGVPFNSNGAEDIYKWMMGKSSETTVNLSSGGVYYIRLHAGNGINTEPYTLQCTFQPVDDIYEPNDGIDTAAPLRSGLEITAYQWRSLEQGPTVRGDEDWYRFTMAENGVASLSISGWLSTYNWSLDYDRLYLYRISDTSEEITSKHMIGDKYTSNFQLDAGDYAIRLHSGNGVSTDQYILRLEFPENSAGIASNTPGTFQFDQPFPNPFNPEVSVAFSTPEETSVEISIYDITGRRVRTLTDGIYQTGKHSIVWNGCDDRGSRLAGGVYLVRLNAGKFQAVRKVVMVK